MTKTIQPEWAWAALCIQGKPRPFINPYSVRVYRQDVHEHIGGYHRLREGETWREGWKRAYREGWRAVRVRVTLA